MINKYVGHHLQTDGVLPYQLTEGKGKGMSFLRVRNGLGLDLDLSLDRAADISTISFGGANIGFLSAAGYVGSAYYDSKDRGFLNSFTAGFLTTCGLNNIGVASDDEGQHHGMHGSISHIPAESVYYTDQELAINIFATMRDQVIFKQRMRLERNYRISKEKNQIKIIDTVFNDGVEPEPLMLLYHINLGYPLIDETSVVEINSVKQIARDARAQEGIASWNQLIKPTAGFTEQTYYHQIEEKVGLAKIYNPKIKKGLNISFDKNQLNYLIQWKMMGENDYVLGIEPANHSLHGRGELRQKGELQILAPKSSATFDVTLDFYY